MGVLNRKLLRDVRGSLGVLATVVVIIAAGTGSFIAMGSAQRILIASQKSYYARYRFADFWVDVKKAPLSAVEPLADLEGIAEIEARIVFDVILDLPGVAQPLTGRLISTPPRGLDRVLNGVHLVRGSAFSDDRNEEVILGEAFAKAHGLRPGDRVSLILNRRRESFVIVGTAISPEYIYSVRGQGDITPDPEHFAILYIKQNYARDLLDFKDACNQIVGRLVPGADVDVETLLNRIDRRLDAYGVLALTPRERQASNRFLSDEITGLGISAVVMPGIFLVVAALVLNVVMGRLAERQRTIIGTLKALGHSDRQVLGHFLRFGILVGVIGGLAGIGVGVALAWAFIEMYKFFFQFPSFLFQLYPQLFVMGVGISVLFAVVGTAKGVWKVLRLHPAEAMRPRPPERGSAMFLERFPRLWRRLGFRTHIALRSLARNPGRTATGVISCAMAGAIILTSLIMHDSVWFLVAFQFERMAHSDVDVGLRDERSPAALREVERLPGVDYAEPVLGMVCDVRHGRYARRMSITGLTPGHRLLTPMRRDLRPVEIPDDGLVLSRKLAEVLDARVGDRLQIRPVRGRREPHAVPVRSVVDSFLGMECYADLGYLSRVVGEAEAVNTVQTLVDPAKQDELFAELKQLPNAQGVSVRATAKANIESTFVRSMGFSLTMLIGFAGVIALGSLLNASLIEISDRTRDIASFRVLGYNPGPIAGIFFRQSLVILVLGMTLALPLAYMLVHFWSSAYNTELFRIPVVIKPTTVLAAGGLMLGFMLLSQAVVYRQIRVLDWLEGIKIKE